MDENLNETLRLCYADLRKKTNVDFSLRSDNAIKRIENLVSNARGANSELLSLRAEFWIDLIGKTPAELQHISKMLTAVLTCRDFIARGRTQNTVYTIL